MRKTEGEATGLTSDVTPSLDLVFDLLSDSRRRYALYYLNDQPNGVATIENLTKNVIAQERTADADGETAATTRADHEVGSTDQQVHEGDSADRQASVRMELQHIHLPKLEDAGILEHDTRSETVRYWSQPSVEEWLEHAQHKEMA